MPRPESVRPIMQSDFPIPIETRALGTLAYIRRSIDASTSMAVPGTAGVVMGLEFAHPQGAKFVMRHLYDNGVWAIFSTLDPRVLQYKPGILLTPAVCEELLERTEVAIGKARDDAAKGGRR